GGSRCSPLTSLTVAEKKSLREKKVGFAEKKRAYRKQWSIVWKAYPSHRTPLSNSELNVGTHRFSAAAPPIT
ncbi:MAG: hypothetical protein PUE80_00725, partial [bacterium]|nr:hypothetical protein [bacterium]